MLNGEGGGGSVVVALDLKINFWIYSSWKILDEKLDCSNYSTVCCYYYYFYFSSKSILNWIFFCLLVCLFVWVHVCFLFRKIVLRIAILLFRKGFFFDGEGLEGGGKNIDKSNENKFFLFDSRKWKRERERTHTRMEIFN